MAGEKARVFSCPKCAASITARGMGQTNTIICSSCMSALDLDHPEAKVLYELGKKRYPPNAIIPLGTRGKLRGELWEVIGFMHRTDGSGAYGWNEYLLFNPNIGFRWLVQSQGHWNYVTTTKTKPKSESDRDVTMLGETFKHFLSGTVITRYVMGEFYWRAKDGDQVQADDYVCPPRMLSKERTKDETVWSMGEYVEPDVIQQAFKIKDMPERMGVAPNQPNTAKTIGAKIYIPAVLFFIALTFIQMFFSNRAQNQPIFSSVNNPELMSSSDVLTTPLLKIEGGKKNLAIYAFAPLANDWVYLSYVLFNQDTGETWTAGRELSFYSGSDSDGYWKEGSQYDKLIFPAIPSGNYVLTVTTEGSPARVGTGARYQIKVVRDVSYWGHYYLALALLLIYPICLFFFQHRFEINRWNESDYPIYESEE